MSLTTYTTTESFNVTLKWTSEKQEERYDKIKAFGEDLLKRMENAGRESGSTLSDLERATKTQTERLEAIEKKRGELDRSLEEIPTRVVKDLTLTGSNLLFSPSFRELRELRDTFTALQDQVTPLDEQTTDLSKQAPEVENRSAKELLETASLVNRLTLSEADNLQVRSHLSSSEALVTSTTTVLETKRQIEAQIAAAAAAKAKEARDWAAFCARVEHENKKSQCSIQ